MNQADVEFVRQIATAVLWKTEEYVEEGMPFDDAKALAVKRAASSWRHLTKERRDAVLAVCNGIALSDLSDRCRSVMEMRHRRALEATGRLGWFGRSLLRLTGLVP